MRKKQQQKKSKPVGTTAAVGGEVVLYKSVGGQIQVDVRLDRDTVWLSLSQMSKLFGRDKSVISRHLGNVFDSRELRRSAVIAKNATTAADGKTYEVEYFNLDAILSVGYRVNSRQGTQFRIWATQTLRDHLLRGYTLNEKRLRERGLDEVEQAVDLLSNTLRNQSLVTGQGRAVLDVVQRYTRAWRLLLEYDEDRLAASPAHPSAPTGELTLRNARAASTICALLSPAATNLRSYSAANVATSCTAFSARSSRHSEAKRCIPPRRHGPHTCCTSSSRTIRFQPAGELKIRGRENEKDAGFDLSA